MRVPCNGAMPAYAMPAYAMPGMPRGRLAGRGLPGPPAGRSRWRVKEEGGLTWGRRRGAGETKDRRLYWAPALEGDPWA